MPLVFGQVGGGFDAEFVDRSDGAGAELLQKIAEIVVSHRNYRARVDGLKNFESFLCAEISAFAAVDEQDIDVAYFFDHFAGDDVSEIAEMADLDAVHFKIKNEGGVAGDAFGFLFGFALCPSLKGDDRHITDFVFARPVKNAGVFFDFGQIFWV
ncbi:MAG: hypothetical protein WC873_03105 [Candidatus Gracilibacteria bacterium]